MQRRRSMNDEAVRLVPSRHSIDRLGDQEHYLGIGDSGTAAVTDSTAGAWSGHACTFHLRSLPLA